MRPALYPVLFRRPLRGGPDLDLNFAASGTLDPRVTYSGASLATLTDATGAIAYKPHNLLTYSEAFDNAAWTGIGTSVTANATTAPDGNTTADKVVATATINWHGTRQIAVTLTSGVAATLSVYAKAAEETKVAVSDYVVGTTKVIFDLSAVTAVVSGSDAGLSLSNPTITNVAGGWYRCTVTMTASVAGRTPMIYLRQDTTSYAGDGTSGIYLWGAQLNIGPLQPYYPTTSAAYYGPRFTYDPVTHAALGLLIEEQRTNLLTYSEQFDNAAWTPSSVTVTANATTAPDGTATADLIFGDGTTNQHYVTQSLVWPSGATHTLNVFAKAGTAGFFHVLMTGENSWAQVNLSTGAVTFSGAGTATAFATDVKAYANGWYRIAFTCAQSSGIARSIRMYPLSAATNTAVPSEAMSSGIYLWGAQLEAGAFATSYIPTTSASVTRAADSATMTGSNFSSWFNATQGTLYVEGGGSNAAGSARLVGISDGTTLNRIINYLSGATQLAGLVSTGGVAQANPTVNVTSAASSNKLAQAYVVNNVNVAANGTLGAADTSATIPTVTLMRIGADESGTGAILNGTIARLRYYNTALTNAQLQALTT